MDVDVAREITDHARSLFDVVGVSQMAGGDTLLILGLETTPERNLDEFGHLGGGLQMFGFEKYAEPRLESLLTFIRSKGVSAELVGRYGYPPEGELNLKREAIRAGLGRRGKSTVVLHPRYGPRLRFMAVRTNARLSSLVVPDHADEVSPACSGCSICIDACPVRALEPYHMPDISICLSNISPVAEDGRSILCDICLHLCPAAKE